MAREQQMVKIPLVISCDKRHPKTYEVSMTNRVSWGQDAHNIQ